MKRKHLTETPVCPQERLVIISNTTGLSFAPLAEIITIVFYLLVLYLSALSNTSKNLFASICSDSLIKTACQHLLLLVGFDTLIYQKYYDTPPILVGHQDYFLAPLLGSVSADFVSQEHGVPHNGPKDSNAGGCTREIWITTKHGDGSLEMPKRPTHDRERH
jgi:hypothetical protein